MLAEGTPRDEAELEVALRAVRRWGIEAAVVPGDLPVALADRLREGGIGVEVDARTVEARRRVKTPAELEGIRRAQRAAERGMAAAEALIRGAGAADGVLQHDGEPLTAETVRAAIRAECAAAGAPAPPGIMVVSLLSGGGHDPGSGPLPAGLPIEVDLWPRDEASGCWADMTRTFVGDGEVTDEVAALRDIAREALEAARAAARPGVTGRALYDAACDVVERAGYPTQRTREPGQILNHGFYFGLGHGVGLEVHEPPGLGLAGHDELVAGRRDRDRARHRGHRGHRRRPLRGPPADHRGRQRDADRLPLRPLRRVADGLDVVAVGVEHVGAVVVGVVDLADPGRAVVGPAGGERGGVERVDGRAIGGRERDVHVRGGCGRVPRSRSTACRPRRSRPPRPIGSITSVMPSGASAAS